MCVYVCVCESDCVVSRTHCTLYQRERKVRRTLTSTRFQLHMPTVTTNTGLKCCFKLCVYLFYLLKKTLHTYTDYLDKYKAANPCSCFRVQHSEGWGWLLVEPGIFTGVKTLLFSVQSEVRTSETLQCPLVLHCLSAEATKHTPLHTMW